MHIYVDTINRLGLCCQCDRRTDGHIR